jgi:hypothetical protein
VDISDPANPDGVGFYGMSGFGGKHVVASGSLAYVANFISDVSGWVLRVVDVSDPTNPVEVGSCITPETEGLALDGTKVYIAGSTAGLRTIDASDPAGPIEVGRFVVPFYADEVEVVGDYAYVASNGLHIVDVTAPANPIAVGAYEWTSTVGLHATEPQQDVAVRGDYAYLTVSDWPFHSGGLLVVDIRDPAIPVEVGFYQTPGDSVGVALQGDYAYLADLSGGLCIVDIGDPENPAGIACEETTYLAKGVAVSGDEAYIADGFGGLRVFDVSNPASPGEIGSHDPGSEEAVGVAIVGNHAYVANTGDGLRIVDVSNPATPLQVGHLDSVYATDVEVVEPYAYVSGGGLYVIDVSEPLTPVEVGFYDASGREHGVAVMGDLAYVAGQLSGLSILRVGSPSRVYLPFVVRSW